MLYVVIDEVNGGDTFTEEFDSEEKALNRARYDWDRLTNNEKKRRNRFFVLKSENPDENAENHFDGDIIKSYK